MSPPTRIWLRGEIAHLRSHLNQLIGAVERAEEIDLLMPGYTHLQPAQPVRWSHWLLSHVGGSDDAQRLMADGARQHHAVSSGAAGNPLSHRPQRLADDLGFEGITYNSMDGVSDRDFTLSNFFWRRCQWCISAALPKI